MHCVDEWRGVSTLECLAEMKNSSRGEGVQKATLRERVTTRISEKRESCIAPSTRLFFTSPLNAIVYKPRDERIITFLGDNLWLGGGSGVLKSGISAFGARSPPRTTRRSENSNFTLHLISSDCHEINFRIISEERKKSCGRNA